MDAHDKFSIDQIAEGLQKAREYRGISQKDTAAFLGISPSVLRNYEKGKYFPSLPVLESLSYLYHLPLDILASPERIEEYVNEPAAEQLQQLIQLRQNIISTTLQIAFEESGLTQKDAAKAAGITRSKLRRYLNGEEIPLDDLKKLTRTLQIDLARLIDQESPIGVWQKTQKASSGFAQLPEDIQAFMCNSDSWDFIYSAYSLHTLGADEIEGMAKALLHLNEILQTRASCISD